MPGPLAHRLEQISHVTIERQRARLEAIRLLPPQVVLQRTRHRLAQAQTRLELLSPKGTLARGYSITCYADGRIVRTVGAVRAGDKLTTTVADGAFPSIVAAGS